MTRYGMVIDVTKCNGCYNCFIVCKDEYCENDHKPYSVGHAHDRADLHRRSIEKERGQYPKVKVDYVATLCQQCDEPGLRGRPTPKRCTSGTTASCSSIPKKADGNKDIVTHCPYRVIYWNDEKKVAQKCTFCAHLLDEGWKEPRCVEACPTGTLVFGDLDDPSSEIAQLVASGKTEPLAGYKYGRKGPLHWAAQGVRRRRGRVRRQGRVRQGRDGHPRGRRQPSATTVTDGFGDFEFEGLPANATLQGEDRGPGLRAARDRGEDLQVGQPGRHHPVSPVARTSRRVLAPGRRRKAAPGAFHLREGFLHGSNGG